MRSIRAALVLSLASALVLGYLGPVPMAQGITIAPTVFTDDATNNGNCTLREAVIAANGDVLQDQCPAGSGADTISLAAGTYSLSIAPDGTPNDSLDGDLDITESLAIVGSGSSLTTIDGGSVDRVIHIDPGLSAAAVTGDLSGLTVRGGYLAGSGDGAGLRTLDALNLSEVTVTANETSGDGGAVDVDGTLTMTKSILSGNKSGDDAGGIDAGSSTAIVSITDSVLSGNSAGGDGGAIANRGTATILGTTVSGNVAGGSNDGGGGILNRTGATLNVLNSTISGNSAAADGGGIHQQEGGTPAESVTSLGNVTITSNTADSDAGGTAGAGGGISIGSGTVTATNSIIAGNHDPTSEPDCAGTLTSGGHNLIGQLDGCTFSPGAGDLSGTATAPLDPRLGPLADNGGPSQTHALLEDSPAINTGDPSPPGFGGTACVATDQRGLPRSACDVGAYELVLCRKVPVNRIGTEGKDTLNGTAAADGLLGLGKNDKLSGKGGKDGLCGGPGKDTLRGGGGKDRLDGGPGQDTCMGQAGKDKARACEKEKTIP